MSLSQRDSLVYPGTAMEAHGLGGWGMGWHGRFEWTGLWNDIGSEVMTDAIHGFSSFHDVLIGRAFRVKSKSVAACALLCGACSWLPCQHHRLDSERAWEALIRVLEVLVLVLG